MDSRRKCRLVIRAAQPGDGVVLQAVVEEWWGHPIQSDMLSPSFLTHFRETCLVAEQAGEVVGFLIGFLSQALLDEAYIRLVVVNPRLRRKNVGRALYETFFAVARQHGRRIVRSVTSPSNKGSIAFHLSLGFAVEPNDYIIDGLPICCDYHGRPGTNRVLFVKRLED